MGPEADVMQTIGAARDAITVRRVFGEPYERDGVAVIPVAAVRGGAGGGGGKGPNEEAGSGGGFGVSARPVGAYVVREGDVTWHPAVDVTRVVLAAHVVAVALALVARSIVRAVRH